MSSLDGVLSSFEALYTANNAAALKVHRKLVVRTVLALAAMELTMHCRHRSRGTPAVEVVSALPALSNEDGFLAADVAPSVSLPHSVWRLVSFVLDLTSAEAVVTAAAGAGGGAAGSAAAGAGGRVMSARQRVARAVALVRAKMGYLALFFTELYARAQAQGQEEMALPQQLYDDVCTAVLSRLLQAQPARALRPFVHAFATLRTFGAVPVASVGLYWHQGQQRHATSSTARQRGAGRGERVRAAQSESLALLSLAVLRRPRSVLHGPVPSALGMCVRKPERAARSALIITRSCEAGMGIRNGVQVRRAGSSTGPVLCVADPVALVKGREGHVRAAREAQWPVGCDKGEGKGEGKEGGEGDMDIEKPEPEAEAGKQRQRQGQRQSQWRRGCSWRKCCTSMMMALAWEAPSRLSLPLLLPMLLLRLLGGKHEAMRALALSAVHSGPHLSPPLWTLLLLLLLLPLPLPILMLVLRAWQGQGQQRPAETLRRAVHGGSCGRRARLCGRPLRDGCALRPADGEAGSAGLEMCLGLLHGDMSVPATRKCIDKAFGYLAAVAAAAAAAAGEGEGSVPVPVSVPDTPPRSSWPREPMPSWLLPVLGGWPPQAQPQPQPQGRGRGGPAGSVPGSSR